MEARYMTPPHDPPQRQVEPKTPGGQQTIAWGLIAVLLMLLLFQTTKKISSHRTATDSTPLVHVAPAPGAEQPSDDERRPSP